MRLPLSSTLSHSPLDVKQSQSNTSLSKKRKLEIPSQPEDNLQEKVRSQQPSPLRQPPLNLEQPYTDSFKKRKLNEQSSSGSKQIEKASFLSQLFKKYLEKFLDSRQEQLQQKTQQPHSQEQPLQVDLDKIIQHLKNVQQTLEQLQEPSQPINPQSQQEFLPLQQTSKEAFKEASKKTPQETQKQSSSSQVSQNPPDSTTASKSNPK